MLLASMCSRVRVFLIVFTMDVPDVPPMVIFLPWDTRRYHSLVVQLVSLLLALGPRMAEDERWRVQYLLAELIDLNSHFTTRPAVDVPSDTASASDSDTNESSEDDEPAASAASNASMGGA